MKIIKNIFFVLFLVAVISASFWFSFTLGKMLMSPKKTTSDNVTSITNHPAELDKIEKEKNIFSADNISLEVEVSPESTSNEVESIVKDETIVGSKYIVQSGIFSVPGNANSLKNKLTRLGFDARITQGKLNTVYIPAESLQKAKEISSNLTRNGFEALVRRK